MILQLQKMRFQCFLITICKTAYKRGAERGWGGGMGWELRPLL